LKKLPFKKTKIIKPQRLEPGDTIGLISPSGSVCGKDEKANSIPDHLEKGLDYIEKMGYKYILGKHALKRRGYFGGADKERLDDLHAMFGNKKVKAIFCITGGYGTPRLLPYLDYELIRKNPKIFEGYSDITALLTDFHQKTGLVTFHGPMVNYDFGRKIEFNKENLWKALTRLEPLGEVPQAEHGPELITLYSGRTTGRLIGGNLSLLVATLGTPYEIDTTDAILFLEDVEEQPYRLDRMLNHLLLAGKLQAAKGIIIGECVKCDPVPPDKKSLTILEVLHDLIVPLKKPAFFGLCFGHGSHKLTLPIGVKASMDANHCKLVIEESGVS
jgi:muramoyltetrapeptide carboxypeptidase